MRVVILQSNYLPWKGYFDLIHDADLFVYYDEVQYTKNDWRNRNRICSKNGLQWLTIPIAKAAVKQKISEVSLPEGNWQGDHFKSLYYAYKPAPYFHQLEPLLQEVYQGQTWTNLSALNRHLIERIAGMLGIQTRFADVRDYAVEGDRVSRLVNLLQQVGATHYLSGPSARDYLAGSEPLFAQAGIELAYKDYSGYPPYRQLSEPFEPAVSIVDLLANLSLEQVQHHIWGWRKDAPLATVGGSGVR